MQKQFFDITISKYTNVGMAEGLINPSLVIFDQLESQKYWEDQYVK